ncbi:MAG: hypothetical protein J7641_07190 [Cyanobacteria bacterium SID2]|nr:hypothetical protein [Cyanobacteria bacterium SID2]
MTPITDDELNVQQQLKQVLIEIRSLKEEVEVFNQKVEGFNQKFDSHQKATQWVVQLAFSLIAAATVTVIVSTVLGK